jgi:predicted transglutaminase-like cysteine proteinase
MQAPKVLATLAIACAVSATAYANCRLPTAPSKIPDGATASQQQMLTAMQTIQEYNHDVQTYLKCLDFEVRQNQMSSDHQASLHNAAVDQLKRIAAEFNRQVVIFKSKHS